MDLNIRKLKILEAIVNTYITTGEPVSSKVLCHILNFAISSATIRSEMAELTNLGLLDQPHTSSGRVPSHFGYRVYVDQIMNQQSYQYEDESFINSLFSHSLNAPKDLLNEALEILAKVTQCAAVSVTPSKNSDKIKNVQLILSGRNAVLLVLVTSFEIKNKIIRCDCEFPIEVLSFFQEMLQKIFQDTEVSNITSVFIQEIIESLPPEIIIFFTPFVNAIAELSREAASAEVALVGQTNLFFCPEFTPQSMRQTIDFLSSQEEIIDFFLQNQEEDITVLIGEESGFRELYDLSIIMSKYDLPPQDSGILAIIGPTRMNYAKLIPRVRGLALAISQFLNQILGI